MEHDKTKWQSQYDNFFDTKIEIGLRALSFIFLLLIAGKVPSLEEYMQVHNYVREGYTAEQYILVFGNAGFFLFAVVWDILAAIKCHLWTNRTHQIIMGSDLLALSIWIIIMIPLVDGYDNLGAVAFYPMLIALFYCIVTVIRVWDFFRNKIVSFFIYIFK